MKFIGLILVGIILTTVMPRGFSDSQLIKLPLPDKKGKLSLEEALNRRHSVRKYQPGPLELRQVSQILWAACGTNIWGSLTSPSAGALYPLTVYLIAGEVKDLAKGLYKYNPGQHSLTAVSLGEFRPDIARAALNQSCLSDASAVIVICADYHKTSSRYGQRGHRYVEIEVGHLGQNIYLQAQSLGLGTVAVGAFNDEKLKAVLKVKEDPLYIMPLGRVNE